jgi:hypothetical protein
VLRRIFGPEREEDGSWRKLHNDELHNLYYSPNIVRVLKSKKRRIVYKGFVGGTEWERPLGRPRHRWEVN